MHKARFNKAALSIDGICLKARNSYYISYISPNYISLPNISK